MKKFQSDENLHLLGNNNNQEGYNTFNTETKSVSPLSTAEILAELEKNRLKNLRFQQLEIDKQLRMLNERLNKLENTDRKKDKNKVESNLWANNESDIGKVTVGNFDLSTKAEVDEDHLILEQFLNSGSELGPDAAVKLDTQSGDYTIVIDLEKSLKQVDKKPPSDQPQNLEKVHTQLDDQNTQQIKNFSNIIVDVFNKNPENSSTKHLHLLVNEISSHRKVNKTALRKDLALFFTKLSKVTKDVLKKEAYPIVEMNAFGVLAADSAVSMIMATFFSEGQLQTLEYRMVAQIVTAYLLSFRNAKRILMGQKIDEGVIDRIVNVAGQSVFVALVIFFIAGKFEPGNMPNTPANIAQGAGLIILSIALGYVSDRESREQLFTMPIVKKLHPYFKNAISGLIGQPLSAGGSAELVTMTVQYLLSIFVNAEKFNPFQNEQVLIRAGLMGGYAVIRIAGEFIASKENLVKWDDRENQVLVPFSYIWVVLFSYLASKIYAEDNQQDTFDAYPVAMGALLVMLLSGVGYRIYNNYQALDQESNNNNTASAEDQRIIVINEEDDDEREKVISDENTPLLPEKDQENIEKSNSFTM